MEPFLRALSLGLVTLVASCSSVEERTVGAKARIATDGRALVVSAVTSIDGTYGDACLGRSGHWSVATGSAPTTHPPLSVVQGDVACRLTLDAIVADGIRYDAAAPMTLGSSFQAASTAFAPSAGGAGGFRANAHLSSTEFEGDVTLSLLLSSSPDVLDATGPTEAIFSVGGLLSGLTGVGLVLSFTTANGTTTLTPTGNGPFAFPPMGKGPWSLTVSTQPHAPTQVCSVVRGAGVADTTDVTNLEVTCLSAVSSVVAGATVVGTLSGPPPYIDGTGSAATFNFPSAAAIDADGNVFVADQANHCVRKVTPAGVVTTLAGTGSAGFLEGAGLTALFNTPMGIALDGAGNVYVADQGNQRIRKISAAGVVSTFAGTGAAGFTDGAAASARFYNPRQLAFDGSGNLYVADCTNNRIRRISPAGVVSTVAGASNAAYQDGTGSSALFSCPSGVASDASGNLVVADTNNRRLRRVSSAGVVTTLAGSGVSGGLDGTGTAATFSNPFHVAVDAAGNTYLADYAFASIRKITPAGVVTTFAGTTSSSGTADGALLSARFVNPRGIAIDASGNLAIADTGNNEIRWITGGVVSTLAGSSAQGYLDGVAPLARYSAPSQVVAYSGGTYVIDTSNHRVRVVTPSGSVSTLAGSVGGYLDGTGAAARLYSPASAALDASGNLYVADQTNNRVRKITPGGVVTTLAGASATFSAYLDGPAASALLNAPFGIAVDASGTVFASDRSDGRIRRISGGNVSTFAGPLPWLDANGTAARFNYVAAVAVDSSGAIYVADRDNHRIRKITSSGDVTTFAGSGVAGLADGSAATARFNNPSGVAVDASGNVYVADYSNNSIRVVSSAGVVSTFAGSTTGVLGNTDAVGTAARFFRPIGLAVDASGNVYVADSGNHRVRRITPGGVVTTVAGTGTAGFADGAAATALLNRPTGVAVDGAKLYIADASNMRIRLLSGGTLSTVAGTGISGTTDGAVGVATLSSPLAVVVDANGGLVFVESGSNRLRRIASGTVSTLAGASAGFADASGTSALFYSPIGLALDGTGNVVVADATNSAVRRVTPSGGTTTIAGVSPFTTYDGTGVSARFNAPNGMVFDENGNLYVAGANEHRVRKITTAGVVTTLAGSVAGYADNTGTSARLNIPRGLAYDGAGNLYVADSGNNVIRKIVIATGAVTTVAGASSGGFVDGVGSAARFSAPYGVAVGPDATLVVADTGNDRIRSVSLSVSGQLAAQWGPAFDATGSPIQRFVATATAAGQTSRSCTASAGARSCTIAGLTSGASYTVTVVAYDANDNPSPTSASASAVAP